MILVLNYEYLHSVGYIFWCVNLTQKYFYIGKLRIKQKGLF